jgi:GH24 family phage-related lysozyme (muramidase)
MTPQELLQQQRRQQVDFNLSLPSVTSRELQAGQYSVAVQRTPKAEQTTLGRLADALGKVNPIIAKYGDAQIAENERQILDVQQKIASMDPVEKEKLLARPEAEVNLAKAFRGDYELNPVATIRLKMLLGAEKNVEFNAVLTERIDEFKNKFLRENGDKPSYSKISEAINEITKDYLESSGLNSEDKAIMRAGFLQEASVNINKLKQTLPSAMAEEHKQDLLIPNLASSLARMHGSGDRDLERLKSHWEASSSSLSRSEQIKVIDATLGILNFDSSEDELDDGIAFLEDMRDAGVAIGTTRLDSSGTPLGESFYEMKLDDLEEMREAVVLKERKKTDIRVRVKADEYKARYRKLSKAGYSESSEEIVDDIEKEQQKIRKLEGLSPYEKNLLLEQVTKSVKEGFSAESDIIDALEIESGRSNASPQAMLSETRRMLVTYVQKDLEGEKYKGVDVSEALIGKRIQAVETADPRTGDEFETFALGPELQNILSEKNQQFLTERAEAMELVARLDPGEEITLGDKVYTIEAGENIERKRNAIIAEHMTKRMGVIMASSKDAVDDLLAGAVKKTEEETKVKDEETARLDKIAEEKGLTEKSKEMIKLGPFNAGEVGAGQRRRGKASQKIRHLSGTGIEPDPETVVNMPKFLDNLEHTFRYNPYTQEQTQLIKEDAKAIYMEARPALKANLKDALESSKRTARAPVRAEREAKYLNLGEQVLRARRLFLGYDPEEVKKALSVGKGEAGYLPEGVRIADPKSFFRNELLGEERAASLLIDATDEQVAEISKLLDVDAETLKKRQEEYNKAREVKVPEVETPVTEPEPTVETPEPEPAKKERKPKARPPIPEGPSFENYKRSRSSRPEQLELPLDNAKPAVGSVDKTTTDMIKQFEGEFQPKAFWDVKQYSIGFGTKARKGQTMTLAQAEKELAKELAKHAKKVDSYDKVYNWTPNERAAMISFAFNLGNAGFDELTRKGTRNKQEIAAKMLEYNNKEVDGKLQFNKGLDKRRKAERKKFLTK